MPPTIIDLMGQRFGKLVVIEFAGTESHTGRQVRRARWVCKCDCGNTTTIDSTVLRRGKAIGCGKCRSKIGNQYGSYNLKTYDSAFKIFYRTVKLGAEARHLTFKLSMKDVKNICKQTCFYCGTSPKYIVKVRNKFGNDFIYNGIDRVDNSKGYTPDNVVPCCKKCNQAKMNLTVEQFKLLIRSIYNNWAKH